ncbi:MAG: DUF362 domain-containing protein [Candidatus Altiarchaeota archaeon]
MVLNEMKSRVYFLKAGFAKGALKRLFKEKFSEVVEDECLTALKLHMGEPFNPRFIKPDHVREISSAVLDLKGKPFLTDTTTLYKMKRFNALDYLETAYNNGFRYDLVDAPVVIADGLLGEHGVKVEVDGILKEVEVAQAVYEADALISLAHCTGHISFGYGGAIKNLGMGCVTKNGKRMVHCRGVPVVDEKKCVGCGECAKACSYDVISIRKYACFNMLWCVSCGRCIEACPQKALSNPEGWMENYARALVESARGVVKNFYGRLCYINFLLEVSEGCDCRPKSDLITEDIGVLASSDLVAVEKASLDLIRNERKDFAPQADLQIKHAVRNKLGNKEYEIVEFD